MKLCVLQFRSFLFKCDIRLNDVSLARLDSGQNLATTFGVNEWVRKSENLLTINLEGSDSDLVRSAMMRIDIGLGDTVHGDIMNLFTVELGPKDAEAGIVTRPLLIAALPFDHYDDSLLEPIDPADRNQMESFLHIYEDYYRAMASKDIEAVMRYHEYRCGEFERRYYEPQGTRYQKLRKEIEHSFENEFILLRAPGQEKLNAHMFGRLLTMDYAENGKPLTTYTGVNADYTRAYQAYWGRNAQGEFFIYR